MVTGEDVDVLGEFKIQKSEKGMSVATAKNHTTTNTRLGDSLQRAKI